MCFHVYVCRTYVYVLALKRRLEMEHVLCSKHMNIIVQVLIQFKGNKRETYTYKNVEKKYINFNNVLLNL